ncbi:MAG: UDP-galactopyranose mutase [Bacteroidetes bacterium]|nr:UDP-galactopyranose mutase [Bacteroidota bacterium]
MYDYIIVGAGLFGAVFAHEAHRRNKKCLVIEKRNHIGGNCYTEVREGINVHVYGPHIFHTSNQRVWNYVHQFVTMNRFTNSPIAMHKGKIYNLPFNMNTFYQIWGVTTPQEAQAMIEKQRSAVAIAEPTNLEEQALKLVGHDIYEILIKGYTEKQWGRKATELPPFIIKRLPLRFTFDNNYFDDLYQGIPIGGYTQLFEKLLTGIEVKLQTDFFSERQSFQRIARRIVYTGMIDQFYDYCYGKLEYRSLYFEHEVLNVVNYQGNAIVNYTEREIPYTRIIEHKHFEYGTQPKTIITREYPREWVDGMEPYYPINTPQNMRIYEQYADRAKKELSVIFGGRLAEYRYYDMHHVIANALKAVQKEFGEP